MKRFLLFALLLLSFSMARAQGGGCQTIYYSDADGDGYGIGTPAINVLLQGSSSASCSNGSLVIVGSDSGTGNSLTGSVSFVAAVSATYSFDWSFSTSEDPAFDPAYYINGIAFQLTNNSGPQTQSGTKSVTVAAGSTFGFSVVTADDVYGSATLTINNFNGFTLPTFTQACSQPVGYVLNNTDCNDANSAINPTTAWYLDADGDGYGTGTATNACAQPAGYVTNSSDCNNSNAAVNPAATEICNSIDDDCDTQIDEGLTFTNYYADTDGDGFGAGTATNACAQPTGYVINNTDCNDTNIAINPTTVWYLNADGDGYYVSTIVSCTSPGANYNTTGGIVGDCNDNNPLVRPGVTETCNGIDDDCDGMIDENSSNTY